MRQPITEIRQAVRRAVYSSLNVYAHFLIRTRCPEVKPATLLTGDRQRLHHGWSLSPYYWCRKEESNLRPMHYECTALPTELFRQLDTTKRVENAHGRIIIKQDGFSGLVSDLDDNGYTGQNGVFRQIRKIVKLQRPGLVIHQFTRILIVKMKVMDNV